MAGFDRFTVAPWANAGTLNDPTQAQADAGFAWLGPVPPSVEMFNSIFRWNDDKDNWLFNQIDAVIQDGLGVPASELPNDQLLNALGNKYVAKAGDTMTGVLAMAPMVLPTVVAPGQIFANGVSCPLLGGINFNNYGEGTNNIYIADGTAGFISLNINQELAFHVFVPGLAGGICNIADPLALKMSIDINGVLQVRNIIEIGGNGVRYRWGANDIGFAWSGSGLALYVDGTPIPGWVPVFIKEASAPYSLSSIDALTAIMSISLGNFNVVIPNDKGIPQWLNVPIGLLNESDKITSSTPYLVRAIQQLHERLTNGGL